MTGPEKPKITKITSCVRGFAMWFRFLLGLLVAMLFTSRPSEAEEGQRLLESRESLYNNIYVYQQSNLISLTFGYNRRIYEESLYNTLDDEDLPVTYTRFMTAGLIYPKKIERILEIGFGGGRTSWYLHRFLPAVPVTSVELDPAVLDLARKYFHIRDEANFTVATSDGRTFLKNSNEHYDVILVDAYRGPFVPFHLLTKEFYTLAKEHLSEGGVLVQNIEPTTMLFDSAVLTINSVFPQMDFFLADGNVVTVAYDKSPPSLAELQQVANERQQAFKFRYNLNQMLSQRRKLDPADTDSPIDKRQAKVLTDDFAPVEMLKAIEQHNRKWPDR
jgi:spermidine synthase